MQNKIPLTPYGKEVKHRLIELDKTNGWLVKEINKIRKRRQQPDVDTSFLSKVLNGKIGTSHITSIIDAVLTKEEERQKCNQNQNN